MFLDLLVEWDQNKLWAVREQRDFEIYKEQKCKKDTRVSHE